MYSSYSYYSVEPVAVGAGLMAGAMALIAWLFAMAAAALMVICLWKIFKKAGKEGWAAIVPVYNIIMVIEISGLPLWYIALFFVPFANIYAVFKIYIELAKKFGKDAGFGVLCVFLPYIGLPILAFSKSAVYQGAGAVPEAPATGAPATETASTTSTTTVEAAAPEASAAPAASAPVAESAPAPAAAPEASTAPATTSEAGGTTEGA